MANVEEFKAALISIADELDAGRPCPSFEDPALDRVSRQIQHSEDTGQLRQGHSKPPVLLNYASMEPIK